MHPSKIIYKKYRKIITFKFGYNCFVYLVYFSFNYFLFGRHTGNPINPCVSFLLSPFSIFLPKVFRIFSMICLSSSSRRSLNSFIIAYRLCLAVISFPFVCVYTVIIQAKLATFLHIKKISSGFLKIFQGQKNPRQTIALKKAICLSGLRSAARSVILCFYNYIIVSKFKTTQPESDQNTPFNAGYNFVKCAYRRA